MVAAARVRMGLESCATEVNDDEAWVVTTNDVVAERGRIGLDADVCCSVMPASPTCFASGLSRLLRTVEYCCSVDSPASSAVPSPTSCEGGAF